MARVGTRLEADILEVSTGKLVRSGAVSAEGDPSVTADGGTTEALSRKASGQGLDCSVEPDYLLPHLSQFRLTARASPQREEYKALLIHCFMEFTDILCLV